LHDAVAILAARARGVTIGDEDLAAAVHHDVGRRDEGVRTGFADARLPERQQQLAVAIELEDLEASALDLPRFVEGTAVGDPDVALGVDVQAVRLQEHSRPEALHELARSVEHQHRDLSPAFVAFLPCGPSRRRRSMQHPQITVRVDVGVGQLAPGKPLGKVRPVGHEMERARLGPRYERRPGCDGKRETNSQADTCDSRHASPSGRRWPSLVVSQFWTRQFYASRRARTCQTLLRRTAMTAKHLLAITTLAASGALYFASAELRVTTTTAAAAGKPLSRV